jgi:hypothetical protein
MRLKWMIKEVKSMRVITVKEGEIEKENKFYKEY